MHIDKVISHARHMEYMSGVERDAIRKLHTSEFFTPTDLVKEVLAATDTERLKDPESIWIDNSCGDGQFLSEILILKIESGIDFETALNTIYGIDLMQDNIDLCRERLLCGREDLRHIVEKNIVCADSLEYNYCFGDPETFGNNLFQID